MKNENKKDVVKEALENIEVFEEQFRETGTFDKKEYHRDMDLIMDLVLYYHLGRIIRPIHETLKAKNNDFMQLNSTQRNIIGNLAARGDCTIGELAGFATCSYKNMSKFLEDVEQAGYAARYTDPKCRRFTYVTLTEKGKEFHGRFQTETHKEAKKLFDSFFSDEQQLEIIKRYAALGEILSEFDANPDLTKDLDEN